MPSFLTPANPHAYIHNDLSIIDGASTYLAAYALDFSYLGVYLANLLLGVGCGWLMERSLPKNILVAGVFLACLSFIFFSDMFTPLSTILEFAIQSAVQRTCFHWGGTQEEVHGAQVSKVHPVFAPEPSRPKVTAVIVLYRMKAAESPAFQSVMIAREQFGSIGTNVEVLLWDNSPTPDASRNLPEGVYYFADESNSGLARAYNRALAWADDHKSDWLLTLDQDTAVPSDFFVKMAAAVRESSRYPGVGAIVPQIAAGGKQLSPNYFQFGAIPRWYRTGYVGVPSEPVSAFNSGSMLNTAALKQVGGYDPRFWLDNSDAMVFSKLHEHGKRVYVAGDIQVEHEFSMKDMQRRMSPERYRNALFAETAFWDLRMSRAAGWERTLRLALRMVKQWWRKDSADLRRITWHALIRRLFTSRQKRIAEWNLATQKYATPERMNTPFHSEVKVSVCMAAYNGGAFVEQQLQSILAQLKPQDEVVIVDDCSTDDTLKRIAQIGDATYSDFQARAQCWSSSYVRRCSPLRIRRHSVYER